MEGMSITIEYGESAVTEVSKFDPYDAEPTYMIGFKLSQALEYTTQRPLLILARAVLQTQHEHSEPSDLEMELYKAAMRLCVDAYENDREINGGHSMDCLPSSFYVKRDCDPPSPTPQ